MRVFNTRKGETAAFFTLDDGFASADISVNSDLYQMARNIIRSTDLIVVLGDCSSDERNGNIRLDADHILTLTQVRESALSQMTVSIAPDSAVRRKIRHLQNLLDNFRPGRTAVQIRYGSAETSEACIALGESWCVNPEEELIDRLCESFGTESIEFGYDRWLLSSEHLNGSSNAA